MNPHVAGVPLDVSRNSNTTTSTGGPALMNCYDIIMIFITVFDFWPDTYQRYRKA